MSYTTDIVLAGALEREVERIIATKNPINEYESVIEYMRKRIIEIKEIHKNEQ